LKNSKADLQAQITIFPMAQFKSSYVIEISFKLSGTNLPEVLIDHINQFPAFI